MRCKINFQRARSDEQIHDRIQEIVKAACAIYESEGYEGLTFSKISEHTKFTRPNIYKYFNTKDEILLIIMKDDYKSFISSLIKSFRINKLYSLYEITKIWTNALLEHSRFLDMSALLSTLIENNVSVQALAGFKKEVIAMQDSLVDLLSQLFPDANSNQIQYFAHVQLTLAFALYPTTKLTDRQLEAIKLAGLDYMHPEFRQIYMSSLYQLMYCLKNSIDIKK